MTSPCCRRSATPCDCWKAWAAALARSAKRGDRSSQRCFDRHVDGMGLLGAAVANNASWCDAVCRSHGFPGTFGPRLWRSTRHRLRLYPNAITLRPEVTAPEVLPAVSASQPCGVKDSFARLDLAPAGFRLTAEGNWIVSDDGPDAPPDDSLSWDKVTRPGELSAWETAWADGGSGDGPVFRLVCCPTRAAPS